MKVNTCVTEQVTFIASYWVENSTDKDELLDGNSSGFMRRGRGGSSPRSQAFLLNTIYLYAYRIASLLAILAITDECLDWF